MSIYKETGMFSAASFIKQNTADAKSMKYLQREYQYAIHWKSQICSQLIFYWPAPLRFMFYWLAPDENL